MSVFARSFENDATGVQREQFGVELKHALYASCVSANTLVDEQVKISFVDGHDGGTGWDNGVGRRLFHFFTLLCCLVLILERRKKKWVDGECGVVALMSVNKFAYWTVSAGCIARENGSPTVYIF